MMFWKRKEPCFHDWKTFDFRVSYSPMSDMDNLYDIACTKCLKTRTVREYEYNKMKTRGFIST